MKTKILFIGSFLSNKRGTKGVSENIKSLLEKSSHYSIRLVSKYENKILRLLNIVLSCAFFKYQLAYIDVFSGRAFYISFVASWVIKIREKKIVMTLHGGKLPEFYRLHSKLFRKALDRADYIQTPSKYLQDFFQSTGLNINYLPNPINLVDFHYKFKGGGEYSLLWVRAFSAIYNPDLAIHTLYEVRKSYHDATLTMIGPDKGELASAKKLIMEYGLQEAVIVTGPVPNDQLFRHFHNNRVYLNTTSYESFGVAVMEAAACGTPIVSSNVGELPYLWTHDENILFAEKLDAISFAEQICRIFEDKKLAQKLSVNARKKAEQYDWQVILPRWIELLERV